MACLALGPGAAPAQDTPAAWTGPFADTLRLSLEEALARAREANPAYLSAANDLELSGVERQAAWAQEVLPRLSVSLLNTSYDGRLTRQAFDFFGNPIDNPDADFVYSSRTTQGAQLQWSLQGRSLLNALDRRDAVEGERAAAVAAALLEAETGVERSWWRALEAEALLEVERELVEARRVELDLAERLFSLAVKTRVDVLNARLEVEQQTLRAAQQARAREQALLALRSAIGDPDLPPVAPLPREVRVFDPATLDGAALARRAVAASPTARSAAAALASARVGVREARASWWPRLDAQLQVGRYVQGDETAALFDVGGFGDALYSAFSVGLSFPFFNEPFSNRVRTATAAATLDDRRRSLRETRLLLEQEVASALVALRNQHETLVIAERALAIAEEALALAREEYKLTTRTFEQLQQAIDQEREAARQVVEARYGFVDALVTLEDAVGGPVAPGSGGEGGGAPAPAGLPR